MAAGRLHDGLVGRFGVASVFRDKEAIRPGYDWIDEIQHALDGDVVVLALLGPQWTDSRDAEGRRRLDDPEDSNRVELEAALTKRVPVIPILVEGANMPGADDLPSSLRALTRRNAVRLRDDDWDADFARLAEALTSLGLKASPSSHAPRTSGKEPERRLLWLKGVGIATLVLIALVVVNWPSIMGVPAIESNFKPESAGASPVAAAPAPVATARNPVAPPANSAPAAANPVSAVPPAYSAPSPTAVNITGMWRDINYAGVIDQVMQDGRSLRLKRWGVLPNGIGFESTGEGTIDGTHISHRYSTRYQTGAVSTGSCTGTAAADGSRIEGTCIDSLLGTIPVITVRQ